MADAECFGKMFDKADNNGNGELCVSELRNAIRNAGYSGSDAEIKRIFKAIDVDADGKVSRDEFLHAMGVAPKPVHRATCWRKVFREFDKDLSGYLSRDELEAAVKDISDDEKTEEELDRLLAMCDTDGDGKVCYEEFLEKVISGNHE